MGTVQAVPHFVQRRPANKSGLALDRIWCPAGIGVFLHTGIVLVQEMGNQLAG